MRFSGVVVCVLVLVVCVSSPNQTAAEDKKVTSKIDLGYPMPNEACPVQGGKKHKMIKGARCVVPSVGGPLAKEQGCARDYNGIPFAKALAARKYEIVTLPPHLVPPAGVAVGEVFKATDTKLAAGTRDYVLARKASEGSLRRFMVRDAAGVFFVVEKAFIDVIRTYTLCDCTMGMGAMRRAEPQPTEDLAFLLPEGAKFGGLVKLPVHRLTVNVLRNGRNAKGERCVHAVP